MKKNIIIIFLLLFSSCRADVIPSTDTLFVAFWNIENLFDTKDDPLTQDEEFLPDGEKAWTDERLDKKMYNLARALKFMNDSKAADVIGFAECENKKVLETFVSRYLKWRNYKIIYAESPDERGIDCGFLYDSDKFSFVKSNSYEIKKLNHSPTRLILEIELKARNNENIVFFVNHWPSRRDGASESEYKRIEAAKVLKSAVNKLFEKNENEKIIIMGDFNDEPSDESILTSLGAEPLKCELIGNQSEKTAGGKLYNSSYHLYEKGMGTISYRGGWNMFDQIIISSGLLNKQGMTFLCGSFSIFDNDLVATRSGKYEGTPFPTYAGKRYLGGYSDHFAVTAKFLIK